MRQRKKNPGETITIEYPTFGGSLRKPVFYGEARVTGVVEKYSRNVRKGTEQVTLIVTHAAPAPGDRNQGAILPRPGDRIAKRSFALIAGHPEIAERIKGPLAWANEFIRMVKAGDQAANLFADWSQRSESTYVNYKGYKFRFSDHALPEHYARPDWDIGSMRAARDAARWALAATPKRTENPRRRNALRPHPQSPSVMLTDDPEFDVRFYNRQWRIWTDGGRSKWVQLHNVIGMVRNAMGYDARHSFNGSLLVDGLNFAGAGRLSFEEEDILRRAKGAEMKRLATRALHLLDATGYHTVSNAKDAWRHALRERLLGRKVSASRTLDEPWWRDQMHQLYLAGKAPRTQNPEHKTRNHYQSDYRRQLAHIRHDPGLRTASMKRHLRAIGRRPGSARSRGSARNEWVEFAGYEPNHAVKLSGVALSGELPGVRVDLIEGYGAKTRRKVKITASQTELWLVWFAGGERFALTGGPSAMRELAADFARLSEPVILTKVDYVAPRYPVPEGVKRSRANADMAVAFTHAVENPTVLTWNGQRDPKRARFDIRVKGRRKRWVNRSGLIF